MPYKDKEKRREHYKLTKERKNEVNRDWYRRTKAKRKLVTDAWRERNKDKVKEINKRWRKNNPEKALATQMNWFAKNPEKMRMSHLYNTFGITWDDYLVIMEKQNGECAICGKNCKENGRLLCVDHDHRTGVIRGLLCTKCNSGLGFLKDDIGILQRAISYLEVNK